MQKSKLQFKIQNERALEFLNFALSFSILLRPVVSFAVLLGIFTFSIFPPFAFASNVYIDTGHPDFYLGDTILFSVRVDSENKHINAVEGEVLLDHAADAVSLTDINTSGSTFSLWPGKPLPSEHSTRISFAGGVPSGLNSKDAIVFNFVLKLQETGQIALSPNDIAVYLNDGKGTKDEVRVKDLVIDVLPKKSDSQSVDDWSSVIANDTTPPDFIEAIISRDPYLFDNQYFVSFFATDKGSGISYYEVKEGSRDFARAESPYLLRDQSLEGSVQIKAVDKAGNESSITPELAPAPAPEIPYRTYLIWGLITLAVLALAFWLLWKTKSKIKNQNAK